MEGLSWREAEELSSLLLTLMLFLMRVDCIIIFSLVRRVLLRLAAAVAGPSPPLDDEDDDR